jgi:hypothetical protein
MNNNLVHFEPNIPQEVCLQYADGLNVTGRYGPQVLYTLMDGRRMYVSESVAASIRNSGFKPGIPFSITKRVGPNNHTRWDVNPVTTREEEMEPTLQRSVAAARKPVASQQSQSQPQMRGTGTYGPAPQPAARPVASPVPPMKVPLNVAFGEIVSLVSNELKARGEQWDDQARQAAVCTILIQAARDGYCTMWERGNAQK